ncbi:hypothetical protein ABG067_007766 [Albugo candida]
MSGDLCKESFPMTALRETNALLQLRHPNIIHVRNMVVGSSSDTTYMVMKYAENDLRTLMQKKMKHTFLQSDVKSILQSLVSAVAFMHANWFIHRDLKTANLLYDKNGVVNVCDFGLARQCVDPTRKYTPLAVTLWYRAPELLLGTERYSTAVDMWSLGCVFAELLWMKPLFEGRGEMNQLDQIFRLLGPPTEATWPGFGILPNARSELKTSDWRTHLPSTFFTKDISNARFDLLSKMLISVTDRRIAAQDALQHEYLQKEPKPLRQGLLPTFS